MPTMVVVRRGTIGPLKLAKVFPNFEWKWNAAKGAQELYETFKRIGLTREMFIDKHFTRLKWLRYLLVTNKLDKNLYWNTQA